MITPDELEILRKPEVQEYIREKTRDQEPGDSFLLKTRYFTVEKLTSTGIIAFDKKGKRVEFQFHHLTAAIQIPDCISRDSERPERGMWGMIDWEECMVSVASNGFLIVQKYSWIEGDFRCCDMPRLALLKALEWQIGRKPWTTDGLSE
jgi:hypothetical protein